MLMPGQLTWKPEQDFCLQVSTQKYSYTPVTSGCADYEGAYGQIQQLDVTQVPSGAFDQTAFGF